MKYGQLTEQKNEQMLVTQFNLNLTDLYAQEVYDIINVLFVICVTVGGITANRAFTLQDLL